jgi:hypothetical protein
MVEEPGRRIEAQTSREILRGGALWMSGLGEFRQGVSSFRFRVRQEASKLRSSRVEQAVSRPAIHMERFLHHFGADRFKPHYLLLIAYHRSSSPNPSACLY